MKIRIGDLKERISFLIKKKASDNKGGWIESIEETVPVWANIVPIVGRDGYHPDDLGGGLASGVGYLKQPSRARYRVTVRRDIAVPNGGDVIWSLGVMKKRFTMASRPYLILDKQFQGFVMVEMGDES
ncbi:Phage head closure protein [Candidatus Bealeia paramacronuclearis]|uniref:Phage head closure protein n=1 Tax=Candidatus Bealeia paramacronuclearis TaxID=1921001 RepID=A0ABZ2C3H9_9PROT|nr:Phage head closure protein [Candidatus Bealeia paramacronuclearis]